MVCPRILALTLGAGLLFAVSGAAPAAAAPLRTPSGVATLVGHVELAQPGASTVEVYYVCAPSTSEVHISVNLVNDRLWENNTWSTPGPPLLAVCDGHGHKVTVTVWAVDQHAWTSPGRFRIGEALNAGVNLLAYDRTDAGTERFVGQIASDWRPEYVGGVPARCLSVVGLVTPVAGTGLRGFAGANGDRAPACNASLAYPTSVVAAADGTVYVADYLNSAVRRVSPDGVITTVAGTGLPGFSGDGGPATSAQLNRPRALALDGSGRLYIADTVNNRVRRLDPATGTIQTVAGSGTWGSSGDGGPAVRAQLAGPHGLAVGPDGTLWIADTGNGQIRRVDLTGTVTTLRGTGLTAPRSLAVNGSAVFVSDPGRESVVRLDLSTGVQTTLVGPSIGLPVLHPASLLIRGTSLLVTADDRVLRVDLLSGAVATALGGGQSDVPAAPAQVALSQPQGLASTPEGDLLVADTGHHRILRLHGPLEPAVTRATPATVPLR